MVTCEHCFEESGLREVVEAVKSVVLSHQDQYTILPPMVCTSPPAHGEVWYVTLHWRTECFGLWLVENGCLGEAEGTAFIKVLSKLHYHFIERS